MILSKRTQFYIAVNICLIGTFIAFWTALKNAKKKAGDPDESRSQQKKADKERTTWGWLSYAVIFIFALVNWRTFLFLFMLVLTIGMGNGAPDFSAMPLGSSPRPSERTPLRSKPAKKLKKN